MEIAHIEQLNKKAQELNYERQRNLGAIEQSKKKYEEGIKAYAEKYGVQLTAETLEAEYAKVKAEVEQKAAELEKQIAYIESGEYKNKPVAEETKTEVVGTDGQPVTANVEMPEYKPAGINAPNAEINNAVSGSVMPSNGGVTPLAGNLTTPSQNAVQGTSVPSMNGFANNVPFMTSGFVNTPVTAPVTAPVTTPEATAPTTAPVTTPETVAPTTVSVTTPEAVAPTTASSGFTGFTNANKGFVNKPAVGFANPVQGFGFRNTTPTTTPTTAPTTTPATPPTGFVNNSASVTPPTGFVNNTAPATVTPPTGFTTPVNASGANAQMADILGTKFNG